MVRCPVCESVRVVIVVAPARRAFCIRCGTRWVQEGSLQRSIRYSGTVTQRGGAWVQTLRG
jgi:Zn-finger nucleic acid-binding protein